MPKNRLASARESEEMLDTTVNNSIDEKDSTELLSSSSGLTVSSDLRRG